MDTHLVDSPPISPPTKTTRVQQENIMSPFILGISMTQGSRIPAHHLPPLSARFEPRRKSYAPAEKSKLAASISVDDEVGVLKEDMVSSSGSHSDDSSHFWESDDEDDTTPVSVDEWPSIDEAKEKAKDNDPTPEASYRPRKRTKSDPGNELVSWCKPSLTRRQSASGMIRFSPPVIESTPAEELAASMERLLSNSFNIYKVVPLIHSSNIMLLARPLSAEAWCVAVIHQRWLQCLGYKWQIPTKDFIHYAQLGRKHIRLSSPERVFFPERYVLHQKTQEIMQELQHAQATRRSEGPWGHFRDEAWATPRIIVPEILHHLPLTREDRLRFGFLLTQKWKYLHRPYLRPKREDWGRVLLMGRFWRGMVGEMEVLCAEIGERVEVVFWEGNGEEVVEGLLLGWDGEMVRELRKGEYMLVVDDERREKEEEERRRLEEEEDERIRVAYLSWSREVAGASAKWEPESDEENEGGVDFPSEGEDGGSSVSYRGR